jgi:aminoglycoside 6'-N-acetyltransferase
MRDEPAGVRGERTRLRPACEADADLLVSWHIDPEVARYWDDETFTRAEMLVRLARSRVEAYIVEDEAGEPIGFLQVHEEDADGEGGLDMFLIPGARGRGLGPDAARAVASHLRDDRGWTRVTVDPYLWNEAAVRAWTRAGFAAVSEHGPDGEHTAAWLLMEFRG